MIDLAPFKIFADSNDWFEVWPEGSRDGSSAPYRAGRVKNPDAG